MEKGWLYCVYNEVFEQYDKFTVKLGRTNNLKRRLNEYRTGYVNPSYYICVSDRCFRDSRKAESLLFYVLRRYRLKEQREFFSAPPKLIRMLIERLSELSDEHIDVLYKEVLRKAAPEDILDKISGEDETAWFESACEQQTFLEAFFEKYRFKPIHPEMFPNYEEPAITDLNKLMANVKVTFDSKSQGSFASEEGLAEARL